MPRSYPPAPPQPVVDVLHGHRVPDPYRWLEDTAARQTTAWCAAQDDLCRTHLDALPMRESFRKRLLELTPGSISSPTWRGDRYFFMRRMPDQDHAVFYVHEADGAERALIDPNTLSDDRTTTIDALSLDRDGKRLAYQLSEGGDEESVLRVMDVDTGQDIDGPIDRCRYSAVAWLPDGSGFYYVRKLAPGQVPAGEEQLHRRVYFHTVGADPEADELVFGDGSKKTTYFGVGLSRDGRWLIVSASLGTAPRNDLWIADRHQGTGFVPIHTDIDAQTNAHVADDGRLYLFTNLDAPRNRLAVTDPAAPGPEHWTDLLPEQDVVLSGYTLTDDAVVAIYERDVVSAISIHDKESGERRTDVPLPGDGDAGVSSRPEGGDEVWIGYTDHLRPGTIYRYVVSEARIEPWAIAPGAPSIEGLEAHRVFYRSKDGTRIPMFVVRRSDLPADGARPTIVNGYGGFNITRSPAFTPSALAWAEHGGIYAVANLRGGGEYGEEWHRAGMRENKQNVFDDFIAAAEHLVADGWTSPDHLGITGGSNGGLLVGAALTQRPDLYRAVVCSAPLLDMIRYELFGLGETWNDEYGTVENPTELGWLLSYSPYHHVRAGVAYPAVLFEVFESDTRVDPMHARKMCAALQQASSSDHPILLRRETKVGHGARSVTRSIDLAADSLAFLAEELGVERAQLSA